MTRAHLICRHFKGVKAVQMPEYESHAWDIPEDDARQLVGGVIYLHETKRKRSYFGGMVTGYRISDAPSGRIIFLFNAMKEAKGIAWEGRDHERAHYSGVLN
jgi:hypothetical protein